MASPKSSAVDAYLQSVPSPQRETLESLRATLRTLLPHAEERMKYAMPAFTLAEHGVAAYASFKAHCGYFPMSSTVLVAAGDAISRYETSKGGLRFPIDQPLPVSVVRRLVKLRLAEFDAVTNGARRAYYPDGQLKAAGRMKDGQLHGAWKWYRQDGSLMRTGSFKNGEKAGTWQSFDRDGSLVRAQRH
jgi:uncharacterized protein YdhG (YjbR/CyaY superfamily)